MPIQSNPLMCLLFFQDPKCNSTKYECYVIDSSGYIVLAKDKHLVGQFFGRVHKHVLQSFLDTGIFDHVEVFNYQALCPVSILVKKNNSWSLKTVSWNYFVNLFSFFLFKSIKCIAVLWAHSLELSVKGRKFWAQVAAKSNERITYYRFLWGWGHSKTEHSHASYRTSARGTLSFISASKLYI